MYVFIIGIVVGSASETNIVNKYKAIFSVIMCKANVLIKGRASLFVIQFCKSAAVMIVDQFMLTLCLDSTAAA